MTGQKLLELASRKIGQKYVFGAVAPKNNPWYNGPWDCAELGSWTIFQVTGRLFGCNTYDPAQASRADAYTGFYERDAVRMGTIVSIQKAASIPGAILLLKPKTKAIGHLAFSDGRGGTVEAMNPRKGVVRSVVGRRLWDYGILIKGVQYVNNGSLFLPVEPPSILYRLRTPLMEGPKVREIQNALLKRGYHIGIPDGLFGPKTHDAVVDFQKRSGLEADGVVGEKTAKALGITLS